MSASNPDIDLAEILRVVWRRKFSALLVFFLVCLATIVVYGVLPRWYHSESRLFVRLGRENLALDPTSTLGQASQVAVPQMRKEEINSVVEMIHSRQVIEEVVQKVGEETILSGVLPEESLPQTASASSLNFDPVGMVRSLLPDPELAPRDEAILELEKNLGVRPFAESNVIQVTYTSKSPKLSQAVVAHIVDIYLQAHLEANRTPGAYEFLETQTARLRKLLEEASTELTSLREKTSLVSVAKQRDVLVEQIAALEKQRQAEETRSASVTAEIVDFREKLAELPERKMLQHTEGIASNAAEGMRQLLYSLELREQDLLARYTPDHPEVRQIRDQILKAKRILDAEVQTRPQTVTGPNRLHEEAELAILTREPALVSAQAATKVINQQLADSRQQLRQLNSDQHRIEQLEREVVIHDAAYRKYAVSLEESRLDEALKKQRISNISIVQPASWDPKPASPRLSLTLMGGFCLAVFLALGVVFVQEFRDQRIHRGDDVEQQLELPTLASIPRIKKPQKFVYERS